MAAVVCTLSVPMPAAAAAAGLHLAAAAWQMSLLSHQGQPSGSLCGAAAIGQLTIRCPLWAGGIQVLAFGLGRAVHWCRSWRMGHLQAPSGQGHCQSREVERPGAGGVSAFLHAAEPAGQTECQRWHTPAGARQAAAMAMHLADWLCRLGGLSPHGLLLSLCSSLNCPLSLPGPGDSVAVLVSPRHKGVSWEDSLLSVRAAAQRPARRR